VSVFASMFITSTCHVKGCLHIVFISLFRGLAFLWANFHWRLMAIFGKLGLLDDDNIYAVPRVLLGALGVVTIGMFLPQTLFWGEWEFPVLATLSPASDLPHVWPTSGLLGFEMDSGLNCVIVGFCKLIAISFTVAGGYRGGFSKSISLPSVYEYLLLYTSLSIIPILCYSLPILHCRRSLRTWFVLCISNTVPHNCYLVLRRRN